MASMKNIDRLRFRDIVKNKDQYTGLHEGLVRLPLPKTIQINYTRYSIPADMKEFTDNICYGQRLFLGRDEENDYGAILRVMDGYYYPVVTGEKWDEDNALLFGKKVLTCMAKELYPVAMHLTILMSEMAERERELLHRQPSKLELAAGIEKLNIFTELLSLDFLRTNMNIPMEQVLLTPYNECLVRFLAQKETVEYQERYYSLMREINERPKSKHPRDKDKKD